MNIDVPNRGIWNGGVRRQPQVLRPIGAFDEPRAFDESNTSEVSLGIIPPPVDSNDFEIKPSLISMVERSTFKGSSIECPFEHLDRFERLCRTLKMNGVPDDTIRMMLFPFSLEDKGAYWERTIPSHLVTTWARVKTEFLRKFFPRQKTVRFRNDIQSFQQRGDESLSEAWDRLKGLTRSCPHHGMSRENLLGIFYRGALNEIQRDLDIASYGSFASLDCEQAELLIENFAESEAWYGGDYDRNLRDGSSANDAKFEELSRKLDMLSKDLMMNKRNVAYIGSGQRDCQVAYQGSYQEYGGSEDVVEREEMMNDFGNQGGYNYNQASNSNTQSQYQGFHQPRPNFAPNYQQSHQSRENNFQQQGATSNQVSQNLEIEAMFQSIMEGQEREQQEAEKRFKRMKSQLDQAQSTVKYLEIQMAQVASSSKRPIGTPPRQSEGNPKDFCKAIELRSGRELPSRNDEITAWPSEEEDNSMKVEPCVDKGDEKEKDDSKTTQATKKKLTFAPPPYEPKVPFPGRVKKQLLEKQRKRFMDIVDDVMITIPLLEAIEDNPTWKRFFKDLVSRKKRMEEGMMIASHECSLVIQESIPRKLKDPVGKFHVPTNFVVLEMDDFSIHGASFGAFLSNLPRLLWWLSLLLLALLLNTKLKLFPGESRTTFDILFTVKLMTLNERT